MRQARSLSSRLVVYWVAFSLLAFFTVPVTVLVPLSALGIEDLGYVRLEGLTSKRARVILISALRKGPEGAYVEMTDALRAHIARNPSFRYAAFDATSGVVLPGSDAALAEYFRAEMTLIETYGSTFHIVGDPNRKARGSARMVKTPIGRFGTIVYGADFHWDDLVFALYYYLTIPNLLAYALLCAALSLVALFVVRKSLQPLRASAATVSEIDLDSLDRRVPVEGLPSEVVPFINAVNAAFQRVDDGVARQRRFIANSAHELRTPIAILRTRVDKLDETEIKRELKRDAQRIQTILEQLLVLAQVEERGASPTVPEIDLGETALAVAADYTPLALAHGRRIAFEGPARPVIVKGYQWAIESVVTNLIENAARAEPEGGTVIVRVLANATVEVVDHGEGVEPAHREMIFEPFWRKSETRPGTGLGLAIARELMTKLHGRVWVEETPGGGATFRLAFPTADSDEVLTRPAQTADA
ncbi:sensor histidine kinase [Methylocystis parvus]|uniref:histidine kinase n=1 Tax=Methylocystis parvus TaxID=134 RepID=A0A6B8M3G6_9HYPH|nr:HAMP domain-containing sensor histidine kinase [Methylocystis parvus]QGM98424.1 HAMP domain-containing histidine kinase [Methylocystis parvus]WBK01242.1 HAMP domain-containing histidine kinase [Methylocystis parvus OBBP]